MYIKKCLICKKEFKTSHKRTMTCSKSCASIWRYQKRGYKFNNKHSDDVEYISGHQPHHSRKSKNSKILLRCRKWGIRFYVYESAFRKEDWQCYVCHPDSHFEVYELDKTKWQEMLSAKPIMFKNCKWCGNIFKAASIQQVYCSNKCRRATKNKNRSERKHKRMEHAKENGDYETISLKRLYKRDAGICYLCGKHLVLNDDYNRPDAPVIEHVIPICKGGTNTWDNVKLSCRNCNSLKGTKILKKFKLKFA